jgi:hypothetical protein
MITYKDTKLSIYQDMYASVLGVPIAGVPIATPRAVYECAECGSLVLDSNQHTWWHYVIDNEESN